MQPLNCDTCGLPYAVVRNGMIFIKSRHHGRTHTNSIDIMSVVEIAINDDGGTHFAVKLLEKLSESGIMIKETYSA